MSTHFQFPDSYVRSEWKDSGSFRVTLIGPAQKINSQVFCWSLKCLLAKAVLRFSSKEKKCPQCTICCSTSTLWTASQHGEMHKIEGVPVITSKDTSSSIKAAIFFINCRKKKYWVLWLTFIFLSWFYFLRDLLSLFHSLSFLVLNNTWGSIEVCQSRKYE